MRATRLTLDPRFAVGEVSPLLFGGFLEHMGRAVYGGVFEPESPHADEDGFRTDVLEALRALEMTLVRYPGGNFVSGYHWRDGVGPPEERPTVRELAWQSLEPNRMGTDEFLKLCRKLDWEPMLTVNLGTGTPEEARDWVEYCNGPAGSRWADLRVENGHREPYGVRYWCLGNEMDGPWQIGHVPAEQYAIRAQQAAKMMKDCDRAVKLVACGSSAPTMPTYLEWDRRVLEHLGGLAHFVSLHRYVGNPSASTADYLAIGADIDRQIEAVDATARHVHARRGSGNRAYLSFDEWNVWYKTRRREDMNGRGLIAPPLIEEIYNLEDALVVAQFLLSFIRHADVVKIANLAQIVNVIAPILTRGDDMLLQSIHGAFRMISRRRTGVALRPAIDGPRYESAYGEVPWLDAGAILDRGGDRLSVFLVNRSVDETLPVEIETGALAVDGVESSDILTAASADAANSWEEPDVVVPRHFGAVDATGRLELPPLSLVAVTFGLR